MNAKNKAIVKMKRSRFVKEHKELVKKLRSKKNLKEEAEKQEKELEKYE